MATYAPCEGSNKPAGEVRQSPGIAPVGVLDRGSPSRTFGTCSKCTYVMMTRGLVSTLTVPRHKARFD